MKLCHDCGQALAEPIRSCPLCGNEVSDGLRYVDDYRIVEVVHEGQASILCKCIRERDDSPVALRIFTAASGVDETIAERLARELEELKKLPRDWFVEHHAIRYSSDSMWYRVSEWLEAESWGDLLSSGRLKDLDVAYALFHRIAAILDGLHKSGHFIPHLILNDILILKGPPGRVDVKIDYKLSRFLDPKMSRPVPLLQNLLDCHPDIRHKRPLDYRSDIWSLGRIFAQILAADLDLCDPSPVVKMGNFPREISILVRAMLAEDPDLRPHSMAEVAEALKRIQREHAEEKVKTPSGAVREIRRMKKTVVFFIALVASFAAFASWWVFYSDRDHDIEETFSEYVDMYAGSVAFVVVEYTILADDEVMFRQRTEGTAFLVDDEGFMLTNRHVACPWLEDEAMFRMIGYLRNTGRTPQFAYQMYLWFEGETAFNRLVGIGESEEVEDVYAISSAYRKTGPTRVEIAGVAKAPANIGQLVKAPLRDDFAVLRVSPVPLGLKPLPLARNLDSVGIKRLSPVMTLGFPLGRTGQVDIINVSVTRGHVRRTFENFFQVDSSIYRGNSGGPLIDSRGRVIGIASAVATDVAVAPLPVVTHLSDIGLVLPVTKAVQLIEQLKNGESKWNGVLDLSASAKIKEIFDTAYSAGFEKAAEIADGYIALSGDPSLLMTGAVMHFCNRDLPAASRLFERVLSIDHEHYQARLLLHLAEETEGNSGKGEHLQALLPLNWHSPGEFFGHLAKIVSTPETAAAYDDSWNSRGEKSWISYLQGYALQQLGDNTGAVQQYRNAALSSRKDEWPLYLALSALRSTGSEHRIFDASSLMAEIRKNEERRKENEEKVTLLMSAFQESTGEPAKRCEVLLQLFQLEPENKKYLAYAAYDAALALEWEKALDGARHFLKMAGREEQLRLGVTLLEPAILFHLGRDEEAGRRLEAAADMVANPWYGKIIETLLGRSEEEVLLQEAGGTPEKILTACTYLGFYAEARGDIKKALSCYREALGSYLDNWAEFEFARQRYISLRQSEK